MARRCFHVENRYCEDCFLSTFDGDCALLEKINIVALPSPLWVVVQFNEVNSDVTNREYEIKQSPLIQTLNTKAFNSHQNRKGQIIKDNHTYTLTKLFIPGFMDGELWFDEDSEFIAAICYTLKEAEKAILDFKKEQEVKK